MYENFAHHNFYTAIFFTQKFKLNWSLILRLLIFGFLFFPLPHISNFLPKFWRDARPCSVSDSFKFLPCAISPRTRVPAARPSCPAEDAMFFASGTKNRATLLKNPEPLCHRVPIKYFSPLPTWTCKNGDQLTLSGSKNTWVIFKKVIF